MLEGLAPSIQFSHMLLLKDSLLEWMDLKPLSFCQYCMPLFSSKLVQVLPPLPSQHGGGRQSEYMNKTGLLGYSPPPQDEPEDKMRLPGNDFSIWVPEGAVMLQDMAAQNAVTQTLFLSCSWDPHRLCRDSTEPSLSSRTSPQRPNDSP